MMKTSQKILKGNQNRKLKVDTTKNIIQRTIGDQLIDNSNVIKYNRKFNGKKAKKTLIYVNLFVYCDSK